MGDMVDSAITFEEALAMTKGMKLQESGERPLTSNRPAGDLQVKDLPLQDATATQLKRRKRSKVSYNKH